MKKLIISLAILAFMMQENLFAQKEFNNWFIGDSALFTFTTVDNIPIMKQSIKYPCPCYTSQIDQHRFIPNYIASVSDKNGNLLFYSNGFSVWDKNYNLMPMIIDKQLYYGDYACYNTLIIQNPGNFNQFYIFYEVVDSHYFDFTYTKYLLYHIVDMTLNNGLGGVIINNVNLPQYPKVSTKINTNIGLIGTFHKNGKGVWLVSPDDTNMIYHAYLLTSNGIDTIVDSYVSSSKSRIYIGQFSADGNYISSTEYNKLILYNFDRETGKVYNPTVIYNSTPPREEHYITEFSQDASKLYLYTDSWAYSFGGDSYLKLTQFETKNPSHITLVSYLNYPTSELFCHGSDDLNTTPGIRLGPDGKIYTSRFRVMGSASDVPGGFCVVNSIGVLDNPDVSGNNFSLHDKIYFKSLPIYYDRWIFPIPPIVFNMNPITISGENICSGDSIKLYVSGNDDTTGITYTWTGPNGFKSNSQNIIIAKAKSINSGLYKIVAQHWNLIYSDSINITVYDLPIAQIVPSGVSSICSSDSIKLLANTDNINNHFRWSNGDTTTSITVKNPGKYRVIIENENGCKKSDSVEIKFNPKPIAQIISDKGHTICFGDTIILFAVDSLNEYKYFWSTGEKINSIKITKSQNVSLFVENSFGCLDSTTFNVFVHENPKVKILGAKIICKDDTVVLSTDLDFEIYKWSSGETTKSIQVTKSGIYSVTVFDSNGCKSVTNFKLSPCVKILGNRFICFRDTILLSSNDDFTSYKWSTVETTKSILITKPGTYSLTVTDVEGNTATDSIEVKQYDIKLTGLSDLDFGSRQDGGSYPLNITLKNESNTPIQIKSVTTKNTNNIFNITTNPVLHAPLDVGSTIDVTVTFKPDLNQSYYDSLIVVIDAPCPITYNSALIGTSKALTAISIPDLTAVVGTPDFCIPLMAKKDANMQILDNLSYTAEIRYDATALIPNESYPIESGDRVISLTGNNIKFINNEIELGNFCGDVVLANKDVTPLRITQFKWDNPNIDTIIQDGSLTIKGLCQRGIARIIMINQIEFQIAENPVIDELTIQLTKGLEIDGNIKVEIFNVYGQRVNLTPTLSMLGEGVRLYVSSLPSGVYFVRIGDKINKFIKL